MHPCPEPVESSGNRWAYCLSNMGKLFLAVAIVSLVVGLTGHSHAIVNGIGKALFGVFLILFFIHRFFGGEESAS